MSKKNQIHGDDDRRFWSYVSVGGGCWNWLGTTSNSGYGMLGVGGRKNFKMKYAHRISYEKHFGEIPHGMYVCHTCDNKLCVNPAHLWLGTPKENTGDGIAKGRIKRIISSKLTPDQVLEIHASTERGYLLARKYGCSQSIVSQIRYGVRWEGITGGPSKAWAELVRTAEASKRQEMRG